MLKVVGRIGNLALLEDQPGRDEQVEVQPDPRVSTVRLLQAGEASESGYKLGLLRYWH